MENEIEQIAQVLNLGCQLKIEDMSITDSIQFVQAVTEFSEKLKPLVAKYILNGGVAKEKSNFLFKL